MDYHSEFIICFLSLNFAFIRMLEDYHVYRIVGKFGGQNVW